ncbi:hypothetical protein AC249_AIPGENE23893 [Exaiptasia diaphana]|nr:hypothetical protein AC249_AIPGENE23893 [Exaiptasia diaphana]
MEICYRTGADCCGRNATVYVRQCYGYPVFMFDDVPEKSLGNRVCIEPGMKSNMYFQKFRFVICASSDSVQA